LNDKDCNSSNAVLPYIKISKGLPFLFLKSLQENRFVYLECEKNQFYPYAILMDY